MLSRRHQLHRVKRNHPHAVDLDGRAAESDLSVRTETLLKIRSPPVIRRALCF